MGNTTESVARLIDGLDEERQRVAAAFGASACSVSEYFHRSFPGMPLVPVAEQAPIMARRSGVGASGPNSLKSRFIDEDIPYGAVPIEMLAAIVGIAVPLHPRLHRSSQRSGRPASASGKHDPERSRTCRHEA